MSKKTRAANLPPPCFHTIEARGQARLTGEICHFIMHCCAVGDLAQTNDSVCSGRHQDRRRERKLTAYAQLCAGSGAPLSSSCETTQGTEI
jgi:hypothetical protein